jgi:hypothetical protein
MINMFVRASRPWCHARRAPPSTSAQLGRRVGQRLLPDDQVAREGLLFGQLAAVRLLLLQRVQRRDAEDVLLQRGAEALGLDDEIEGLVPRDFLQRERHLAADAGVDDDVQAREVVKEPEDVLQVAVLEVQADGMARPFLFRRGHTLGLEGLLPRLRLTAMAPAAAARAPVPALEAAAGLAQPGVHGLGLGSATAGGLSGAPNRT